MSAPRPRLSKTIDPNDQRALEPKRAWWNEPEESAHRSILHVARQLVQDQASLRASMFEYYRLYKARGPNPTMRGPDDRITRRVSFNGVRACINTACAKLSKNKPKPEFLTSDADWSLQQKAKNLTQYLEGLFYEIGLYEQEEDAFRDACIYPAGAIRFWIEPGCSRPDPDNKKKTIDTPSEIRCERTMPDEILVDESESYYGKPRQMFQRRFVDRLVLAGMFADEPDKQNQIMRAKSAQIDLMTRTHAHNMIEVVEAWHLPSLPLDRDDEDTKTDGRHAMAIDGCTLVWEDYRKSYFPFLFEFWERPVSGFWGTGLAEELAGLQYELNEALRRVQIAQKHACAPKILLPSNAKIAKGTINNDLRVSIIPYDGPTPPQFVTPNAMPTEVYNWIDTIWQKMFETTGVSQMTAQSHKPAGLDSGAALREFEDIESERFVLIGQRREQFFIDAAKILLDLSRDLYKDNPDLAVKSRAGKFIRTIKWKDVDLKDDEYTMRAFPSSLLPSTPAGKLQKVTELMANGLIDREQGLALLGFPDTEKFTGLATAGLEDAQMVVDHMINGGTYIAPTPYMDLNTCRKIAHSTLLRAQMRGVDESNIDKLRNFLTDIDDLVARMSPPAPPQGAPMPGGPPTMPGAPPPGAPPMGAPPPPLPPPPMAA